MPLQRLEPLNTDPATSIASVKASLNQEETARFITIGKQHGLTVTELFSAIALVVLVRTVKEWDRIGSPEIFSNYGTAQTYFDSIFFDCRPEISDPDWLAYSGRRIMISHEMKTLRLVVEGMGNGHVLPTEFWSLMADPMKSIYQKHRVSF